MKTPIMTWRRAAHAAMTLCAVGMLGAGAARAADADFGSLAGYIECSDDYLYGSSNSCSLSGCCDDACECTDPCGCGDACMACCSPWGHCTAVWGEAMYLHPTGADMVHAQQQNGIGGAGTVPFGHIGAVDPDYEPAYRLGATIGLSDTSSFSASYMFYESSAVDTVLQPQIPGGGGAVGSLVHHPGAALTASAGPVNATYDIDFQLVEFECRRLLFGDDCGWLNYSVGARFAHLEQDFTQTGVFGGGLGGVVQTRTDVDFDGGGAMFGLDGERKIGRRGLSLYGNAGVSPIVGQFSSIYTMNNNTTTSQLATAQWKDDRFVTILDFELGVAWTSKCRKWRVSSGYVASFWYNTITTPEFVSAVQSNNYVDRGDTLSFDGATARVERRF